LPDYGRAGKEIQKFLKDRPPRIRIRIMQSKVRNARESKIKIGFIEIFSSKTPAIEPLAEAHRFRPELNPVKVLEDVSGKGPDETWRRQSEQEGERGCCAPRAQRLLFKSAA